MTLEFPFTQKPQEYNPVVIVEGVLWFRLPLPMALDHVNVFVLEDGNGWTIIDTGFYTERCVDIWQKIIHQHLAPKPITRVIITHYHPDHIGMAGWFRTKYNAEIITTQISWLFARMLVLDVQDVHTQESLSYFQKAGLSSEELAERKNARPFNFADVVHTIPLGYNRIAEGDLIPIGKRNWRVIIGNGHAPAHATFWAEDGTICLGGDQFLPEITPNIGVYASEPEANPLADWLASCRRFNGLGNNETLILPGHKAPFRGVEDRTAQLVEHHNSSLEVLQNFLSEPKSVMECFEVLFGRRIPAREFGLATAEAYAHLNYLWKQGKIARNIDGEGVYRWQTV